MAWIRGETGSPFARRSSSTNAYQTLVRELGLKAIALIWNIGQDPNDRDRLQALKFIVEQGQGKARQAVDLRIEEQIDPGMMTQAQLMLAADGQTEELVCSLMESGKLNEYTRRYEGVVQREEKDVTGVMEDHLGKIAEVAKAKAKDKPKKVKAKAKIKPK